MFKNGIMAVRLARKSVTLLDGQRIPITNWLTKTDEVGTAAAADRFVAGPCADGLWYGAEILDEDREDD